MILSTEFHSGCQIHIEGDCSTIDPSLRRLADFGTWIEIDFLNKFVAMQIPQGTVVRLVSITPDGVPWDHGRCVVERCVPSQINPNDQIVFTAKFQVIPDHNPRPDK